MLCLALPPLSSTDGDKVGDGLGKLLSEPLSDDYAVELSDPFGPELSPSPGPALGPAAGEALGATLSLGEMLSALPGACPLSSTAGDKVGGAFSLQHLG